MALAVALEVTPTALMMPSRAGDTPETEANATGFKERTRTARQLWSWLRHEPTAVADLLELQESLPWFELYEIRDTPLPRANVMVEQGGRITWHGAVDAMTEGSCATRGTDQWRRLSPTS